MRTPMVDPWDTEGPVCMTWPPGLAVNEPGAGAGRAAGAGAACSGATRLGLARPGARASPAHGVADLRRHNVPRLSECDPVTGAVIRAWTSFPRPASCRREHRRHRPGDRARPQDCPQVPCRRRRDGTSAGTVAAGDAASKDRPAGPGGRGVVVSRSWRLLGIVDHRPLPLCRRVRASSGRNKACLYERGF